ncbi:hypothetical protein EVAR_95303_1 [Eumeta japonica]|uniref:Uncharacterized protein n=1 Tax=Eumeta variegata TaxID=151549 RepID=A0A4C1U8Z1_EUMVA|nr:hypothetical protein EVAR_95303_1 [Eumeta japonica]
MLEQQIAKALEAWRSGADPRLPPADPVILPPLSSVYQQFGTKITFATSEIELRGFKNMTVRELHVSNDTTQGSFRFSVPLITLHSG